jgi:hypothetical protein
MMMKEEWSKPDGIFTSDACLSGCGGMFKEQFFHVEFPHSILDEHLHINALEMLAVIACLKMWSTKFKGKRILIKCDNQVTVYVINTGKSRNFCLQCCLREICFLAAVHEFEIRAVHIAGIDNCLADMLSRWHLDIIYAKNFFESTNNMHLEEITINGRLSVHTQVVIYLSDLQIKELEKDVKNSTLSAFAVGTKRNLMTQWRTFLLLCAYFKFVAIPASLKTVCLYIQFLSRSFKSVESIKNYISGICTLHLFLDESFPYFDEFVVKLLFKGIERNTRHSPKRALAITIDNAMLPDSN